MKLLASTTSSLCLPQPAYCQAYSSSNSTLQCALKAYWVKVTYYINECAHSVHAV
jgi:hypothetical protein